MRILRNNNNKNLYDVYIGSSESILYGVDDDNVKNENGGCLSSSQRVCADDIAIFWFDYLLFVLFCM